MSAPGSGFKEDASMRRSLEIRSAKSWSLLACVILAPASLTGQLRTPPSTPSSAHLVYEPTQLPGPKELRQHVVGGKLQLSLEDAIRLMLLNNTDVHIDRASVDQARYNLLGAYHPFDPAFTSSFNDNRSIFGANNQVIGTIVNGQTLNTLIQGAQFGYSQTLETGTNYDVSFGGTKSDVNTGSSFPFFTSNLSFQLTQPLLRNRGLFPNRAPILIAKRQLSASEASFEAEVNNSIQSVVTAYWNVVGARENLAVARSSLAEAEETYKQDKRKLELGALPPLDIYRSESQVAQRRVAAIQAEYALKQAQDQFREIIGADLDPFTEVLDLDLTEKPEPESPLETADIPTALGQALKNRPELEALRQRLSSDDTSVRLAHNGLLPDLQIGALYASNGIGGSSLNTLASPPAVVPGGLGDALSQLFRFRYPAYGLTFTFNLPIHNRAAQAALGNASVARRADLYELRKEQQTITLDVVNSVHQLEQTKLSMESAKVARDLAQREVEAEQRKYELGAGQIFLVLEAQTELAQAEVSLVQAEIGYQLATTALDRATGTLLDRHHVQIEQAFK